jgi:hypothetical protein
MALGRFCLVRQYMASPLGCWYDDPGLQAMFTTKLIQRRKHYPAILRDSLASALVVRQAAVYGRA